MKRLLVPTLSLFLMTAAAFGEEKKNSPPQVAPDRAVVQIRGVVCSFCAYGTEKNLSQLDFLDKRQFDDDGVLMDIHSHRITLALDRNQPLDLAGIHTAITDGGYDPVTIHLNLHGVVSRADSGYLLACPENGQTFRLNGLGVEKWLDQGPVHVRARLDASLIPTLPKDQPAPLEIMATEGAL